MEKTTIKSLKKGQYFRFKDDENAPLYVRGSYDRSSKRYEYYHYDDVCNFHFARGERTVYI